MLVSLTDYEIKGAQLQLKPATIDTASGQIHGEHLLWSDGDRQFQGSYAFHIDGHFNVQVKPDRNATGTEPKSYCTARFEVPKFAGGHNYQPVDFYGTKDAFQRAEKMLKEVGIHTNIQTAKPCRMDSFGNVAADEPFSCYRGILGMLHGSRMKRRGYEDGFLWENQSAEICVYDKKHQLLHKKADVRGLPKHPIRFELRALQSRKVRSAYGFDTVADLLEGYDHIRVVYQQTMKKQLFRYSGPEIEVLGAHDLQTEFMLYADNYGRNWWQQYLGHRGLNDLLRVTNMDTIMGVWENMEQDKSKRSRMKKSLKEAQFSSEAIKPAWASKRTNIELYNELQEKLLAA
jgi:hypothetical protein